MATVSKSEKEVPKLPTELLNQLTSFVKTEQDLTLVTNQLMKQVVERALQAELSHHLGAQGADAQPNSRNGFMGKILKVRIPAIVTAHSKFIVTDKLLMLEG